MDRHLFNTSVSIATAVVTSSTLAHGHQPYVIQAIIDLSFDTYENLKARIAAVDAAEKVAEEAEFARLAAERASSEDIQATASKAERASVEDTQAATSGLSVAGEGV